MTFRLSLMIPIAVVATVSSLNAANALTLTSTAVENNGLLPVTYSCDGDGISPPIAWSDVPTNTQSLVVIMDHQPGNDSLHWYWTVYNIDPAVTGFEAGQSLGILGGNSVNRDNEYAPPCSKGPGLKRYTIHLYALATQLNASELKNASPQTVNESTLRAAMADTVLEATTLTFNFERQGTPVDAPNNAKRDDQTNKDKPNKAEKDAKRPPATRPPAKRSPTLAVPSVKDSVSSDACTTIQRSVSTAGFNDVTVTCDKTYAYVQSDTYPDHDLMNGITGTNEQIPVPAKNYAAPIPLTPKMASSVTTIDAAVGVAVNGVPIYDYSAQGALDPSHYDAKKDTVLLGQLDNCGGHAGRGDDYHYHAKPTCMIDAIPNANDATILGWGYDGFPIYGDNNPDGSSIEKDTLDVCNGQADDDFGYRYHTSQTAPYIVQCLVGEVDTDILPRVSPLSGAAIRSDLRPPRGGVENLKHTVSKDGTRTLSYEYKGTTYYTKFSPAAKKSTQDGKLCFDFEQKTISNGGIVQTGTFCR